MTTIKPEGAMLIVFPLSKEESETGSGITVMDFQLTRAEVIEVSDEWGEKYKEGDIVLFPDGDGVGKSIFYKKKKCLWINGRPFTENGDVWGKLIK